MTQRDDEGSILPLVLGYAILAIALVIVCACATSLYIAQKQLDAVADAAALAGADGFTLTLQDGEPQATLTPSEVRSQAEALVAAAPGEPAVVSADTPDGRSARVTVTAAWHPPLFSVFVPDGVALTATATSRTGLR
ncbi:MAG: pilus assembly protein TadG-related protein [Microbacterium sp.]|uniref:pilus assembly protein TadG-related protein n=1 Tax=Microbacterium sp. TaxID=51671 RepID=UPI00260C3BA4|nr:pilus assembly protein TadG-related protein [Microbacterium sp.]MCX6501284.1 pilus assembly protein TadG-related protein [Microbacterium sp.]